MAKKYLYIFISFILLVSTITGCGNNAAIETTAGTASTQGTAVTSAAEEEGIVKKTGYPIVKEEIVLEGYMPKNSRKDWNENLTSQWMYELTGMRVNITPIPQDIYQEKKTTALASGDYPDFFFMARITPDEELLYGKNSGYFIDLKALIDAGWAPNFKAKAEENKDIYRIAAIDGAMYSMPFLFDGFFEPYFALNEVWMKNVGMSMPTNLEEFTELLRRFKNNDPDKNGKNDTIPISSAGNVYWYNPIISCFGLPQVTWLEDTNKKIYHAVQTDNYKAYLKWSNDIYKEGLLDNRVPTSVINDEKIFADMQEGKVGVLYTANHSFVKTASEYTALVPFAYGNNKAGLWPAPITLVRGTFAITDKCKYPEAMMRWVDSWYSEEIATQNMFIGKEGFSYKLNSDGTYEKVIPEGFDSWASFMDTWSIQGQSYWPGAYPLWQDEKSSDPITKKIVDGREALRPLLVKAISEYSLTTEESEAIAVISADLDNYIITSEAKFISGELTVEKDWDTFQKTLESIGIEKVKAAIQTAVDRFYSSN